MKAYLDTNVLIAASIDDHQHHLQAFDLVEAVKRGAMKGCISTHGLAEFYSVITRAPFVPRVHAAEANRFLEENILPYFELVELTREDYRSVIRSCADASLIGGLVFDALHLQSAVKSKCDRVYTFNVKDFRTLAPPSLAGKIAAP